MNSLANKVSMFPEWNSEKYGIPVDFFEIFKFNFPTKLFMRGTHEIVAHFRYGDVYFRHMGPEFDWERCDNLCQEVEDVNLRLKLSEHCDKESQRNLL